MRRAVLLLLFVPLLSCAAPIVDLQDAPLKEVAKVLFADALGVQYFVDASVADDVVSVHIDLPVELAQRVDAVVALMPTVGIGVHVVGDVYHLSKLAREDDVPFVYRPRWRSVPYLVDLLSPLFKSDAFSLRRGVQAGQGGAMNGAQPASQSAGGASSPLLPSQSQSSTVFAGSAAPGSALSFQDRAPDVLVFRGSQREIDRLSKLLPQVDTRTPEVLVKAVVYEVQAGSSNQSAVGLALSILGGRLGVSVGSLATNSGDYSAVFKNSTLAVVFDALNADSRFKVVTSPTLRVRSGATAQLIVGNQTPVVGATVVSNGTTTQSVEYKPSGVILKLTPDIRGDVSELQVDQQISSFASTSTGVNNSPTLNTREIQTTVGIGADDVLVLGGLDQDQGTDQRSGLSFLPDWLSSKSSQDAKTQILLVLQAQRI